MAEKTLKRGRAGNLMAIGGPQAVVYIGLAAILIIAQIISPGYLKMDHILTMLRLAAFVGIASIGQTFAVLTGGIDLSIAYVITFANIVGSQVMYGENQNLPAAVLTVLAVGAGVGLVNSMGIKFLKIPPVSYTHLDVYKRQVPRPAHRYRPAGGRGTASRRGQAAGIQQR